MGMSFLQRWCLAMLVLLIMTLAPAVAEAAPSAAVKARARRLVQNGQKALRQGRLSDALRHFKVAFHLWKRKEIQFNIALVHFEMNNRLAAATHVRLFLAKAGPGARAKLPPRFKRLLREVAVLRVRLNRNDASIFVDGKEVGTGSTDVVLHAGLHRVTIRLGGVTRKRTTVRLSRGQVMDWRPVLRRGDRHRQSTRPHGPDHETGPSSSEKGSWRRLHWAYFAVATGLAVAAGAALMGTGFKTNTLEQEFRRDPTPERQSRGWKFLAATHVLTGITAVSVAGAAILAIFTCWKGSRRERPVTLIPGVSPRGASLVLRWTHTGL